MSLFNVCCLLCYSAYRLHSTLTAYEFQALQSTHYQHVIVTLDVDIDVGGSYGVQKDWNIIRMHSKHHTK